MVSIQIALIPHGEIPVTLHSSMSMERDIWRWWTLLHDYKQWVCEVLTNAWGSVCVVKVVTLFTTALKATNCVVTSLIASSIVCLTLINICAVRWKTSLYVNYVYNSQHHKLFTGRITVHSIPQHFPGNLYTLYLCTNLCNILRMYACVFLYTWRTKVAGLRFIYLHKKLQHHPSGHKGEVGFESYIPAD